MSELSSQADIKWNSGVPYSERYGDLYFSKQDGLAESQYIFIENNNIPARLSYNKSQTFIVAETGFGTGLNFLITWKIWQELETPKPDLHFISFEKHPLTNEDLSVALANWPALKEYADALKETFPLPLNGTHRRQFNSGRVRLTLIYDDIGNALKEHQFKADAWYLDGFAPAKNPEMWNEAVIKGITRLSHRDSTFATFTAAGAVRRKLQANGWAIHKVPGFGYKREMLKGTLTEPNSKEVHIEPAWQQTKPFDWASDIKSKPNIVIVGAGLAGATTALALAKRGYQVRVLDKSPAVASGASGTAQLALFAKFPSLPNKISDFAIHCLQFASNYYQNSQKETDSAFWHGCGLLQTNWNDKERQYHEKLVSAHNLPTEFVRYLDADEASSIAGIRLTKGGLYFPQSGWIDGAAFISDALNHDNVELILNKEVIEAEQNELSGKWLVSCRDQDKVETDILIFANAYGSRIINQLGHFPVKALRGQVSTYPTTADLPICVVCGEGYLCPPHLGIQQIGATYDLKSDKPFVSKADDRSNLRTIKKWLPEWAEKIGNEETNRFTGKAGIRCTTPDYTPIVGPVPVYDEMLTRFSKLRVNARACDREDGIYYEGLYANLAYGSKGAATAPIAAEILASQIAGEPFPVSHKLAAMLHPARFLIKQLTQRKI